MNAKLVFRSTFIGALLLLGYSNCGRFGQKSTQIQTGESTQNSVVEYFSPSELLDDSVVKYDPPLEITKGGVYSGNWKSENSAQPAVVVKTSEPVTIKNCRTKSRGIHIHAPWSKVNLQVIGCVAIGLNSNTADKPTGRFIAAEGFESIVISQNLFKSTGGIYLNSWKPGQGSGHIEISQNLALDIDGRQSDGKGGYNGKFSWAQFAQLNTVQSNPDVKISWNRTINNPRQSFIEDTVNLYNSSGTSAQSILIENNLFQGAFAIDPAASYSGGGIMLGDGCESGYSTAQFNTVIETSNYGIAIANGNHQKVIGNVILGRGVLNDGTLLDLDTDAGLYARNYCNSPNVDPKLNFATDNVVSWGSPTSTNANARWDTSTSAAVDPANLKVNRLEPLNQLVPETVITHYIEAHLERAKVAQKYFGPQIPKR